MHHDDTVVKTAEGAEEVKSRSRKLPPRLRSMLVMIDGTRTVGELKKSAATLGAPDNFLDELLTQGLVSVVRASPASPSASTTSSTGTTAKSASVDIPVDASDADRFRAVQKFMNATVVDALGFRAMMFTLKLEKCFTLADLGALIDDYEKAIAKGSGPDVARALSSQARTMLKS